MGAERRGHMDGKNSRFPMNRTTTLFGTVLETVYVDEYFENLASEPYTSSTVSLIAHTVTPRRMQASATTLSTGTYVELMSSSSDAALPTSSGTALLQSIAANDGASNNTLELSIGLPVGILCLGLATIVAFLVYNSYSVRRRIDADEEKLGRREPALSQKFMDWYRKVTGDDSQPDTVVRTFEGGHEAEIRYKIQKIEATNTAPHVLTPKKSFHAPQRTLSSQRIDTLLYSKPPGICHIGSELPSKNASKSGIDCSESSDIAERRKSLWNYESPLSRWFLTKSTYLQDQVIPALKTPTVKLKQLNILTRVNQSRIQSLTLDVESSTSEKQSEAEDDLQSEMLPRLDPLVFRDSSLKYQKGTSQSEVTKPFRNEIAPSWTNKGDYNPYSKTRTTTHAIQPQILNSDSDANQSLFLPIKLDRAPSKTHMDESLGPKPALTNQKNRLKKGLDRARAQKPLPLAPTLKGKPAGISVRSEMNGPSTLNTSSGNDSNVQHPILEVGKEYKPNLMDEIYVRAGEYVRVLARHTDGWCLVEKCSRNGTPVLRKNGPPDYDDIDNEHYLNENRGIVPGICLRAL
ncbi:LAMI_0F01376g1_1 [Lachancea mirantina]|uniref:LAMI_0F01376g1_1 n=1 Tax=Lachancea mirantina TaxID=1230905 RepID=A0A1G4JVU9_9SACH|nr:LAMI_0F01376g1_1 [Lachancea mirantina]